MTSQNFHYRLGKGITSTPEQVIRTREEPIHLGEEERYRRLASSGSFDQAAGPFNSSRWVSSRRSLGPGRGCTGLSPRTHSGRGPPTAKQMRACAGAGDFRARIPPFSAAWNASSARCLYASRGRPASIRRNRPALTVAGAAAHKPESSARNMEGRKARSTGRECGADTPSHFVFSNADASTSLSRLARMHGCRFFIEHAFREAKSELAMADYQVRRWDAWHRHRWSWLPCCFCSEADKPKHLCSLWLNGAAIGQHFMNDTDEDRTPWLLASGGSRKSK